jgi:hypothetical protein
MSDTSSLSSLAFVTWVAFVLAGFFLLALALGIVTIHPAILAWPL